MNRLFRCRLILVAGLAAVGAQTVTAQGTGEWLAPNIVLGLAGQLGERLDAISGASASARAARVDAAAERVRRVRDAIGRRSIDDTAALAPAPPPWITLPTTGDARLKAAVRYQLCNTVLFVDFERGTSTSQRRAAALGLTALTMLQARLIFPYLNEGGRESVVEAIMTGPDMARALAAVEAAEDRRAEIRTECLAVAGPFMTVLAE